MASRGRPKGSTGKAGKKLGITIPYDLDSDLDALVELTGSKKATLITDLLVSVQPHLKKSIEYAILIKRHEASLDDARKYFFNVLADYNQSLTDAIREINQD